MRKIIIVLLAAAVSLSLCFSACAAETPAKETRYLRLHIRANSNTEQDQAVKLLCRDAVVDYLESELGQVSDYETAKRELKKRLAAVEQICDAVLKSNGFSYRASASVKNEFFPVRAYEGVVLDSGYYDALIIGLGSAAGDNWWCVIYPPLCYIEAESAGSFTYKSKIKELLDKHSGK